MKVVMFCENDYVDCADVKTEAEAAAFARGFIAGAYAYDDGPTIAVYTLPDDHQRMVEEQHVGEVIRALEATDPTFNKQERARAEEAESAQHKPKWSDLVRALRDPETAEGATALLDIGCYEDDVMTVFDVLSADERRRIRALAESARDAVRAANGTFRAEADAAEASLRGAVAAAYIGAMRGDGS